MKAEFPTQPSLCAQPRQSDEFPLVDKIVSRFATQFASAKPDQFHQSALAVWSDPFWDSLSAANSAGVEATKVAYRNLSLAPLDLIMAARMLLLMALTGVFAAAWNSDSPEAATSRMASMTRRPEFKSVAEEYRQEWKVSEVSQSVMISREFDLSTVSLPDSIASGTYRVVDFLGRVGWMTIPVNDRSPSTIDDAQPFYSSQSETGRWYFIRVEAAPIIAAPQTDGAVLR